MTVDASQLVWPPFETLYDLIERIKLDPAAVDVHRLQTELQSYVPWLRRGLHSFRPPNDSSRKAIEGGARLTFGADGLSTLEITPQLKDAALVLSSSLELDEIQTYVLVHRWSMGRKREMASSDSDKDTLLLLPDKYLHVPHATKIARLYEQERLFLLQSIESLLWLGEGSAENVTDQTSCLQIVKEALDDLLVDVKHDDKSTSKSESPSLEEVTFRCLRDNLAQNPLNRAADVDVVHGEAQSLYAKHPLLRDSGSIAVERNVLIIILAVIYYHPRKQCTPERFVELASTFHSGLFSVEAGTQLWTSSSVLSCHLASLLLLQVLSLDVHKIIECVGQGKAVGPETSAFLSPPVRSRVDKEFGSARWSDPIFRRFNAQETSGRNSEETEFIPVHATVLLTWAALLTLGGDDGEKGAVQQYAVLATQGNALAGLAALASTPGLRHVSSEWAANVVFSTMTTILIAYQLDLRTLPVDQGQHVLDTLCRVYDGHPSLCEAFWESGDSATGIKSNANCQSVHQPVWTVMHALESLFPALPIPLLRLLTSLASSSRSALAARQYFSSLLTRVATTLSCAHALPDPHIACDDDENNASTVVTLRSPLTLPGTGGIIAIPPSIHTKEKEGLTVSCGSILRLPPSRERATQVIIQWQVDDQLPLGFGFWLLMSRTWHELDCLETTVQLEASLSEIETVMGFFSTLCRRDASAPLAILTIGIQDDAPCVMSSSRNYMHTAGVPGTVDCLTLVSKTLVAISKVFAHRLYSWSHSRYDRTRVLAWQIISHCCRVASTFIPVAGSRRVMVDTVQVIVGWDHRLHSGPQHDQSSPLGTAMVQDLEFSLECCTAANSLVKLITELVQYRGGRKEVYDGDLDAALEWVITRLFPGIRNLLSPHTLYRPRDTSFGLRLNGCDPNSLASARWHIASSTILLLRSSVLYHRCPSSPVISALSMKTGLSTWLFPLLPLSARDLEVIAQDGQRAEEVEAIESCCISWLRLLPDVLHLLRSNAVSKSVDSACEAYCRPQTRQAVAMTPATVLLSYIKYRYFGVCEQTLVMKALYAISEAIGHVLPDLALSTLLPEKAGNRIVETLQLVSAESLSSTRRELDELFGAICKVLISAIQHHPSLTETLFSSGNEKADSSPDASSLMWQLISAKTEGNSLHQAISLAVVAAAAGSGLTASQVGMISRVPILLWAQKKDFWSVVSSILERASKTHQQAEEHIHHADLMAEAATLQLVSILGPRQIVEDTVIPLLPALLERYCSPAGSRTFLVESSTTLVKQAAALGHHIVTSATDLGLISPSTLSSPSAPSIYTLLLRSEAARGKHQVETQDVPFEDTVSRLAEAYLSCQQSTAGSTAEKLDNVLANIVLEAIDADGGELEVLRARLDDIDTLLTLPLSMNLDNETQRRARALQKLVRCMEPSSGTGTMQLDELTNYLQRREEAAWVTHTQLLAARALDDIVSSVYMSPDAEKDREKDPTRSKSLVRSISESRGRVLSVLLSTVQAAAQQLNVLSLFPHHASSYTRDGVSQIGIDAHIAMVGVAARVALLTCSVFNKGNESNGFGSMDTEGQTAIEVAVEATATWLEGLLAANDRVVQQSDGGLANVTSLLLTIALQILEKRQSAVQGTFSSIKLKGLKRLFEAVSAFIAAFVGRAVSETMALRIREESGVAALSLAALLMRIGSNAVKPTKPSITAELDGQYVGTVFSRLHIGLHFAEVMKDAYNTYMLASRPEFNQERDLMSQKAAAKSKHDLEELEAWLHLATQTISSFPDQGPMAFGTEDVLEGVLAMGASTTGHSAEWPWLAILELVAAAVGASQYQKDYYFNFSDSYNMAMDTRPHYAHSLLSYSKQHSKLAVRAAVAWHDRLVVGCRGPFDWFSEGTYDKTSYTVEYVVSPESLQETRLCLFLACEAARDTGTWRLSLPFAISSLRSSTSGLVKDALSLLMEIKDEASIQWRALAYACVADALSFQLAITPQVHPAGSTRQHPAVADLVGLQNLCIERLVGSGQLLSLIGGSTVRGQVTVDSMRLVQSMASILGTSSRLLALASVRSVPATEEVIRRCVASIEEWENKTRE